MDSKQRFLQIYHEFIKDDNMLLSELYIVSFRYITIYHLIFGYITLYTWTSAHPTYPSPYHDIMSTYEMRTRLIIVEGLPDSGKSTTAAMVAAELEARGRNVVCVEEGAADHPADVGDHDFLISQVNAPRYSILGARSQPTPNLIRPMYSIASCCRIRCARR